MNKEIKLSVCRYCGSDMGCNCVKYGLDKKQFKTKEEFKKFLDNAQICVCGQLFTGLHELTCPRIQKLKVKFFGKQDNHPIVNVPKVTD